MTRARNLIALVVLVWSGACSPTSPPTDTSSAPNPHSSKSRSGGRGETTVSKVPETVTNEGNSTVQVVSGESLNARLVSDREHEDATAASLRKALEDFPASCIKMEATVDPAAARRERDKTIMRFDVRFSSDEEKYAEFRQRFQDALKQAAKESWDEVWNFDEDLGNQQYRLSRSDPVDDDKHMRRIRNGLLLVGLNTRRSEAWNRLNWDVYVLDGTLRTLFAEKRLCEFRLLAVWSDGRTELLDLFTITGSLIASTGSGEVYFSPTFLSLCGTVRQHCPGATIPREVEMSENEVKGIRKIKCEVHLCADPNDFAGTQKDFMDLGEEIRKLEPPQNASLEDTRVLWMRKMKLSQEMLRRADRNPATRENLRTSLEPLMKMLERAKIETDDK